MDEYAEYLYLRRPHYRNINPGNITDQLAIRKKLNCKPFKWFMEEVAFDLPKKYPPIEPPSVAEGEVGLSFCSLLPCSFHLFIRCGMLLRIFVLIQGSKDKGKLLAWRNAQKMSQVSVGSK
jgi:hypothetical protein